MILELAFAVAAVAFEHADKPIKNNTGATTVVLSQHGEFMLSDGIKNYFIPAINDSFPGRHFIFSLSEVECKEGKGGLVLAEEVQDKFTILDMRDWTDKDTNPAGEVGRAVCEVAEKGTLTEWHEPGSQKKSLPNYTDPLSGRHQYEHTL